MRQTELTVPEASKNLDGLIATSRSALSKVAGFQRVIALSTAIRELRRHLDVLMPDIMELQNSKLGFLTDKRDGGYHEDIVRDCVIELTLRGGNITGNEMNIISGQCYLTKEFFVRVLREYPGLTDLELQFEVPTANPQNPGSAAVGCRASWRLDGKPNEMIFTKTDKADLRIPVKVNNGMGPDAVLGKAERKVRARIYAYLTGSVLTDGDADEELRGTGRVVPTTSTADRLLAAGNGEPHQNGHSNGTSKAANGTAQSATETVVASVHEQFCDEIEACQTLEQTENCSRRIHDSVTKKELNTPDSKDLYDRIDRQREAIAAKSSKNGNGKKQKTLEEQDGE